MGPCIYGHLVFGTSAVAKRILSNQYQKANLTNCIEPTKLEYSEECF